MSPTVFMRGYCNPIYEMNFVGIGLSPLAKEICG
jgi:hypothetical protein